MTIWGNGVGVIDGRPIKESNDPYHVFSDLILNFIDSINNILLYMQDCKLHNCRAIELFSFLSFCFVPQLAIVIIWICFHCGDLGHCSLGLLILHTRGILLHSEQCGHMSGHFFIVSLRESSSWCLDLSMVCNTSSLS